MNGWIVVAIVVIVVLAGIVVLASARRRDADAALGTLGRETVARDKKARRTTQVNAGPIDVGVSSRAIERAAVLERHGGPIERVAPGAVEPFVPPDPETIGVTRRSFFNRAAVALMVFANATFGAAIVAFLWPQSGGGFGSKIRVGKVSDVKAEIQANNGFLYKPEGRMWVTEYPASALPKAEEVYSEPELAGMREGLLALFQKCPHLGCRVPECVTSQWFECPCHGSQYNQAGEKKGGPAPRGMDRFAMEISGDEFIVDTGSIINGPPIGTNTTGQEAEGPNCISAGAEAHV